MKSTIYRQGDVLIQRISSTQSPKKGAEVPRDNGKVILAYGEVTGHSHAILEKGAQLFRTDNPSVTLLEISEAMAMLYHDEHSPIQLEKGTYRVVRQREYSPEAIRNVAD